MALPGAQVFSFDATSIEETRYEETAHYKLYRDFMADPATFLGKARVAEADRPAESGGRSTRSARDAAASASDRPAAPPEGTTAS